MVIDLPLRAPNEGLLNPHDARGQKIISLHPLFLLLGPLRLRCPGHNDHLRLGGKRLIETLRPIGREDDQSVMTLNPL